MPDPARQEAHATGSDVPLRVLDAGCGRRLPDLRLERPCHLVGIDVSQEALDLNDALDEKILGDLQTFPLPANSFDIVVCWDVLEHLPRPRLALDNLARTLKPGGKMVLGLPNVLSPKALATKFTPLKFHVWFYRRVFDYPHAGRPGFGPFKTYLRWSLRPRGLERFATQHCFEIQSLDRYESESWKWFWDKHPHILALLTLVWKHAFAGTNPRESELRAVLVKPGAAARY